CATWSKQTVENSHADFSTTGLGRTTRWKMVLARSSRVQIMHVTALTELVSATHGMARARGNGIATGPAVSSFDRQTRPANVDTNQKRARKTAFGLRVPQTLERFQGSI